MTSRQVKGARTAENAAESSAARATSPLDTDAGSAAVAMVVVLLVVLLRPFAQKLPDVLFGSDSSCGDQF
jgi:hypothetical protein